MFFSKQVPRCVSLSIAVGWFACVVSIEGCQPFFSKVSSTTNVAVPKSAAGILRNKFTSPIRLGALPIHVKVDPVFWLSTPNAQEPSQPLPANHAAQRYLSAFVSEVHSAVVAQFPEAARIPAPQVLALNNNVMNGYVATTSYCIPLKIVPKNATPNSAIGARWFSSMAGRFFVNSFPQSEVDCSQETALRPELTNTLTMAINKLQPHCPVVQNGDHYSIVGTAADANCSKAPIPDYGTYNGAIVAATTNAIFVYTGLLKSLEEKHVEVLLAHELAHYYLAHGNIFQYEAAGTEHLLNYFFRISRYTDHSKRPVPDDSQEFAILRSEVADDNGSGMEISPFIPGVSLHKDTILKTASFFDMVTELKFVPRAVVDSMSFVCSPFRAELDRLQKHTRLVGVRPRASRWERDPAGARKADGMALACMKSLSSFTFAELKTWAEKSGISDSSTSYDMFKMLVSTHTKGKVPNVLPETRLGDLLMFANSTNVAAEKRSRELAKRAQEFGLGWYTFENEADELGIHLLAIANRVPAAGPESHFALAGRFSDTQADDFAFSPNVSDCRKAYLNNWKDWLFKEKPWVPYFGSFEDSHPSECFRAYDTDMEARLFDSLFAGRKTSPNSPSWHIMQQQLRSE